MLKDMVRPVALAMFQGHLTILLRECNFVEFVKDSFYSSFISSFVFHQMRILYRNGPSGKKWKREDRGLKDYNISFRHSLYLNIYLL
jgi:hypothetical protein